MAANLSSSPLPDDAVVAPLPSSTSSSSNAAPSSTSTSRRRSKQSSSSAVRSAANHTNQPVDARSTGRSSSDPTSVSGGQPRIDLSQDNPSTDEAAAATDPLFMQLSLKGMTPEQRTMMYHFMRLFTSSPSTKRSLVPLPVLASYLTEDVIFLDYSVFTDVDIRLIQGFIRQVRGKIPRVGDIPLKVAPPPPPAPARLDHFVPLEERNRPLAEVNFQRLLESRTRHINHAKVVVDYAPLPSPSPQPSPTSARSDRQAPSTVRTAAEIRAAAQGREKRHKSSHAALSEASPYFGSSLHNELPPATASAAPSNHGSNGAYLPPPLRGRRHQSRRSDSISSSSEYSPSRHSRSPSSDSEGEYMPSLDPAPRSNTVAASSASSSRAPTPSDNSRQKEFATAGTMLKALAVPEPKFRGDSESERERLSVWLRRISDLIKPLLDIELLSWDKPVHHLAIVNWIRGCVASGSTAETWWDDLTSVSKANTQFRSWEEVHAAFKKHFSQPGTKDKAVALLKSIAHRPSELMADYNARFQQAAVNAKLSDEVNKFIYCTSLPEPIRAQLETVVRRELDDSGDPLTPGLFTLKTLMAEAVDSELLLRQARRMSQAASSSSSLNRGAGYHHTSAYPHMHEVVPVPSSFDSTYLREAQQEVMNASGAELNAMAARQPYRSNDRQRPSSYNNSRDNRRGSNNQHSRTAQQQSYGSSEGTRPAYRSAPHTSRPPQQSSPAPRKPHPVFTRGVCDLSSVDIASYNPKATEALKKWPWLSPIKFDLLMCRIKQNLCYSCGMRTNEDHTTDSCRGRQHLK